MTIAERHNGGDYDDFVEENISINRDIDLSGAC